MNFAITDDGIFVVMDTLVTCERGPAFFTSKAIPAPHLDGLICGTGLQAFVHRWSLRVLGGTVAADIGNLDKFAPSGLRETWAAMSDEERGAGTTTIYHFGYDRDEDTFCGFAYRSTDDFESDGLAHGIYTKPQYAGDLPMIGFPNDFVEVCRSQRVEQDNAPPEDRVYIGGQITAYMMQRGAIYGDEVSIITTVQTAYEFDDFEAMYWQCVEGVQRVGNE